VSEIGLPQVLRDVLALWKYVDESFIDFQIPEIEKKLLIKV
jgi:hypothetical protein